MLEKNKKIKKCNNSMTLIFLLLLVVSIGFAYLTSNLSIFGSSLLKGQKWDVHFENVQVSDEGLQIETPEIIDKTTVEYNVTLDKPGDFVEFTVDTKNDGTIDAMVSTVDEIKIYEGDSETPLDSIPDYLDYSVTYADYEDIAIAENHLLKSSEKATYKVHVEYKKDITKEQLVTTQKTLIATFSISFEQADKNAIKYSDMHKVTKSTLSRANMHNYLKNNHTIEIIFLDTGVSDPENEKYTDISEEQDGSILAWMEDIEQTGGIMYVSAKEAGLYVKVPENSAFLLGRSINSADDLHIREIEKIDVSKLDVSNVTSMACMFQEAGYNTTTFEIYGLNEWDTSNVTNMNAMFNYAGYKAATLKLDLSGWNTSNVTNMYNMFYYAGYNATTWSIGDISSWDTSNVTSMNAMFYNAGYKADYSLDLSSWNVNKVTNHSSFNSNVTSKVIPPVWVN